MHTSASKKWSIAKWIIGFIVLIVLFILVQTIGGNPYFKWFFNSLYSIPSATIHHQMLPDGSFEVHEIIDYQMRKPFRGLYREIPPSRYVEIDNIQIWTEGIETQSVEFLRKQSNGFEARVWLVPVGSYERLDPKQSPLIRLHVTYRARGIFENGPQIAQIFRQYWGQWDAPVGKITGIFDFPDSVHINTIYQHPSVKMVQSGNRYTFMTSHFPPESFAEVRFLADPASDLPYAADNPTLTIEEIKPIENVYTKTVRSAWLPWLVLLIIFGFLFFLIFWFMGKEHAIIYQGIYERELPSDDPPDFINAMVKNLAGKVDKDGIASAMMNLYHKDYIDFKEIQNGQGIQIKKNEPASDLSHSEGLLLKILARFATDNVFDFQDMQKRLSKSTTEAGNFNQLLSGYENAVHEAIIKRRYFSTSGNVLAKFIAVIMMLFSLAVVGISTQGITSFLLPRMTILSAIMWFFGGAILMIRKDFFGRWTKEGREYYQKWVNFSRFLSDFSLLSEYPPESIIVWEKYLVYGTALGVAEKVISTLQKFIPREIWEAQSQHGQFYNPSPFLFGSQLYLLRNTASATIVQAQARSKGSSGWGGGGFSGGGGSIGGGSGGGRGGAF